MEGGWLVDVTLPKQVRWSHQKIELLLKGFVQEARCLKGG